MRMKKTIALAVLALAACNKEPEVKVKNATPEQVAAKVREARAGETRLEPGEWQIVSKLSLVEAQGVPAAAAAQMKTAMQRRSTDNQCQTPHHVGRPQSGLLAGRANSPKTRRTVR